MCDKAESIHDTDLNDLPDDDYHSLLVAASQPNYRKKASAALGDIPNGSNSCSLSEAARNILNDLQVKANEDQQRTDRLTEVKFAKFMISDFGDIGFANTDYLLQKSKSTDKNLHFSTTKTVMTDKLPLSTENSSSSASSRMTTADQSRAENSVRCVFETGSLFDVSLKNALRLNPDAIQKGLVNCDTLSALSSMAAKINEKKPEPKKSSCNSYFNDDLFFSKINPAWIPQHEKTDANSVARVHHQLLYRRRNKYGKEDFSCVVNHCADSKDTDLLDDLVNVIGEEKVTTVQSRRNKHNKKRNEKLIHSDDESAKAGMPKLSTRAKSENSIPETNKKEKKDKKHNNNNNNSNQKVTSNAVQEQQQQQVVKVEEEEEEATATATAATAAIVNSVPADAVAENKEKSCWSDLMEECADADEEEGAFLPVVNRRFRRGRQTNKAANSEKATRSKTPPMLAPVDRAAEDWNRRRRGSYEHVGRDGELHNNCRTYRVQNRQNTAGTFRGQGRWNGRSRRGGGEHGGGPGGSWTSRAPPAHAVSLQSSRESSPTKNGAATCSSRNQSAASAPALNTALINAGKNNNSGSNNINNNNNGNISGGWKTARPVCESLCLETSNSSRGSTGQVCSYAAITSGRRSTARRPMVVTKDVPEMVAESSVACQQQQQQQQRTIDTGAVRSSSSTGRANSLPASGNKAPLNLAAFPPLGPAVSSGCHVQQQSLHVVVGHMPTTTLASSSNVVQANLVTAGNRSNNYQRRTLLASEEQSNNERRRFALVHIRVDPSKLSPTARFAMKMWNVFVDNCDQDTVVVMD